MKTPFFTAVVLALASANLGFAGTIYNNTTTDTLVTYFYGDNNATHIGDTVTLGGNFRTLTSAAVQFYNDGSSGTFTATLAFWQAGTSTQIGSSYVLNGLSIAAQDIATFTFNNLNLNVPDNLIFTVAISNTTSGLRLGLNAFEPPSVGSSNNSQIILGTTSGQTVTLTSGVTPTGQGNLYLQLEAIPEPSTISLTAGAGLLAFLAFRKRQ
jgi:hypothetical protein